MRAHAQEQQDVYSFPTKLSASQFYLKVVKYHFVLETFAIHLHDRAREEGRKRSFPHESVVSFVPLNARIEVTTAAAAVADEKSYVRVFYTYNKR